MASNRYNTIKNDQKISTGILVDRDVLYNLIAVARDAFEKFAPDQSIIDYLVNQRDALFVAYRSTDNKEVGFASYKINKDEMYLGGAAVKRSEQGNGLYRILTKERLEDAIENKVTKITAQTQNPKIESGISFVLKELKERGKIADFDISRSQINGSYSSMPTKSIPKSASNPALNDIYAKLDYGRGDAFKLVINIKLPKTPQV